MANVEITLRRSEHAIQIKHIVRSISINHTGRRGPQGPPGAGVPTGGNASQYLRGDLTWQTLNKAAVGLGNVDNTSDLDKPISDAVQAAIDQLVSKNELVFNIRDYGAVGDGTTDDLAAIQDTINAAEVSGGIVFIPHGTYVVSGTPQVAIGGITIRGEGAKSKLLLAPMSMNAAGTTIGIWVNGGSNVLIENLAVDGNFANISKNGTYGSGALWADVISEYGAQTVKNYLYSMSGVDSSTYLLYRCPIRITNATNVVVDKCTITNSISAGVLIDADTVDRTQNILVTNCRMSMTWDNAIYFHKGVRYGSAVSNIISDTQYAGVTSIYCNQILIANNNIRKAGPSLSDSAGIELCAVDGALVSGNIIEQSSFAGITLKNSDETNIINGAGGAFVNNSNVLISGNHINDCHHPEYPTYTNAGLNIIQSSNVQITGNKVENSDYGISLGTDLTYTTVQSNLISNNQSWGIQVGNSSDVVNTIIQGNTIQGNGATGVASYAPVIFKDNIVLNNQGDGVNLAPPPSGLASKTDRIEGNYIAGNLYNGVNTQAGPGNLAIIRNNDFYNQERALLVGSGSNKGDVHFTYNYIADMTITSYNAGDLSNASVAFANYDSGSNNPISDGYIVNGPLTQDGGHVGFNLGNGSYNFKVGGSSSDGMIWVRAGFDRIGFGIDEGLGQTVDHGFDVNLDAYFRSTAVIRSVAGIGNNSFDDSNKTLNIDHTNTTTSSDSYGFFSVQRANPSANNSNTAFGGFIQAQVLSGNIRNLGALIGEKVFTEHNGSGTVSTARANDMQIRVTSGGIISNAKAVNIQTPSIGGGGSITFNTAINIEDQIGPTQTHGIYFEGTGANNDIVWQGDTNLYRSAANTLRTDDKFVAAGGLDAGSNKTTNIADGVDPTDGVNKGQLDTKENVSNKSASTSLGSSNTLYPTQNAVKTYVDSAKGPSNRLRPALACEFLVSSSSSGVDPFTAVAVASGTIQPAASAGIVTSNHPGVIRLRSSTTTNSGHFIGSNTSQILIGGGELYEIIFNLTTLSGSTFRMGFIDTSNSADAVDGAYFEIDGSGVASAKTASNSVRTTDGTTISLSTATWYRAAIEINSDATSSGFTIYSAAGSSLYTASITTNIPTVAGRETGVGVVATNSGTTAVDLLHIDYMSLSYTKELVR